MKSFEEAARKAAEEIQNEYGDDYLSVKFLSELIAKHFAELKATHEKLVELAKVSKELENPFGLGKTERTRLVMKQKALFAIPRIQRVIGGNREKE